MRKLSFLWVNALLGMLLVACSTEEPAPLSGPESPAGISKVRSVDEALPDTLAYVVNFDHNEGFAVLGALREGTPVYAVTECGALDAERLSRAMDESYRRRMEPAGSEPATRSLDESAECTPDDLRMLIGKGHSFIHLSQKPLDVIDHRFTVIFTLADGQVIRTPVTVWDTSSL